ncbi:MAG TPA: DUF362 domain-containing protein [candidate division WOR-3 bacterium]|uniref:DUF362 domain-containing protein n=1 Tax=candidate division WOR-3 bacterium TaxID=2052148 RepID=A0A7C0ZHN3_UNCW3|nr:DUF362 domain-containing protein [candidate division WOR-3 bacterium]
MSSVYFIPYNSDKSLLKRIIEVFKRAHFDKIFQKDDIVAIKLHMGELDNTAFVRPIYVRKIYDFLRELGAKPFLTDTITLYRGSRGTAVDYLYTAMWNGFDFAPIIIADGLGGTSGVEIEVNGKHYKKVKIAEAIANVEKMVVISHFKGHEITGFGGALKNLGMGCSIKEGKLSMHSNAIPVIKEKYCTGCRKCLLVCPVDALHMDGKIAVIDEDKCIGCGECIGFCPFNAIKVLWNASFTSLMEKMVEHAIASVKGKQVVYINLLMDISPECDCYPKSRGAIVPDIGILISDDPVSIDQASFDLVRESPGDYRFFEGDVRNKDKFGLIHTEIRSEIQLEYAEKLGMGEREYVLKKIGRD